MSVILAIDPGNEESAWLRYDPAGALPTSWAKEPNAEVLRKLDGYGTLAVEMVASYGMPVGKDVFETCVWIGRFFERWHVNGGGSARLVYRKEVKLHLCGNIRAKDGNVRAALIDLYGGSKAAAIGLKATPGPLYGMAGDCWSALGVAVTCAAGVSHPAGGDAPASLDGLAPGPAPAEPREPVLNPLRRGHPGLSVLEA